MRAALVGLLAALALAAAAQAGAASWARPQIRVVVEHRVMGPSVDGVPRARPAHAGRARPRPHEAHRGQGDRGPSGPGRAHARPRARPRPRGRHARHRPAPPGGSRGRRARPAPTLRRRGRRPPARPPPRPPGRRRRARAAPRGRRHPRRGRLLVRQDPAAQRLEHPLRGIARRGLRPAQADGVAAADPRPRGLLRRLPLRVGRHVGAPADALRGHLPRRLRLLGLRLEDLPAGALPGRTPPPGHAPWPHGLGDGRRGAEGGPRRGGRHYSPAT